MPGSGSGSCRSRPTTRKALESPVADLKNIGAGRFGGALTAGLFLERFVDDDTPWVHLDIAGPAFQSEPDGVNPKGGQASGSGPCWRCSPTGEREMEVIDELEELELELDG